MRRRSFKPTSLQQEVLQIACKYANTSVDKKDRLQKIVDLMESRKWADQELYDIIIVTSDLEFAGLIDKRAFVEQIIVPTVYMVEADPALTHYLMDYLVRSINEFDLQGHQLGSGRMDKHIFESLGQSFINLLSVDTKRKRKRYGAYIQRVSYALAEVLTQKTENDREIISLLGPFINSNPERIHRVTYHKPVIHEYVH